MQQNRTKKRKMMVQTADIDVLEELSTFLNSAKTNPLEVAKTALLLLKSVPTVRDAILEYLDGVFDVAVNGYMTRIEKEISTGQIPAGSSLEDSTVSEVCSVLCSFVSSNPRAWAPIISTWSLELLGELSSKYASRAHLPANGGLNETLQLWMGCRSARTLVYIATQCLTSLMDADGETWTNSLLDTSVKHSPHFDWVVAHVGGCFPNIVITRVLSCGLKELSQHRTADAGRNAPKLASVVGILGHLAGSHVADIRSALLDLFEWSTKPLAGLAPDAQRIATVPYLLHLASMSSTLLNAMGNDLEKMITSQAVTRLRTLAPDWCRYFGSARTLHDLIVRLLLDCERGGPQALRLLLTYAVDSGPVAETCRDLLEHILHGIEACVRSDPGRRPGLLSSLADDLPTLRNLLLSSEKLDYETATRVISLLGISDPAIAVCCACFILRKASDADHLALVVRLIACGDSFDSVVEQALLEDTDDEDATEYTWSNLVMLLKWESSGKIPTLKTLPIRRAVYANVIELAHLLRDGSTNHLIAEALYNALVRPINGTLPPLSGRAMLTLAGTTVSYFFECCTESNRIVKARGTRIARDLLIRICTASKAARIAALRELLERALFGCEAALFGGQGEGADPSRKEKDLLLHMNHKHSTTMMLTLRRSSVFHAGIVGFNNKNTRRRVNSTIIEHTRSPDVELLMRAVEACCATGTEGNGTSLDALTLVSLLVVQLVSPDVMYNGLPWPEEEFTKVTMERDLYIWRQFQRAPALWSLLQLVATHRPALCYCSVLLRAAAATLLHQWAEPAQGRTTKIVLKSTVRLLDVMAVGQLLPPPLASIRDAVGQLSPADVVLLLRNCLWAYVRDHVPSPALFTCDSTGLHWRDPTTARPPPPYTDMLRTVMYRHIDRMGGLYAQLFTNNISNNTNINRD